MRIELDLSMLADLPAWTQYAGLALAWYSTVGRFFYKMGKSEKYSSWTMFDLDETPLPLILWLISPVLPALVVVWAFLGVASGGLIAPPWRKSLWV
jgi:hypothetical protein